MFNIRMGIPEMAAFWESLTKKVIAGAATKKELLRYKIIGKALYLLSSDPRHPRLHSHEISALTARYGMKVWESYLENNKPAAGRLFWIYGPGKGDITIIGIEPHPYDKNSAYNKITLSSTGDPVK